METKEENKVITPSNEETTQQQPPVENRQIVAKPKKEEYSPERTAIAIKKLPETLKPIRDLFAQPWETFRSAFKDPREADIKMQREVTYAAQAMMSNSYLIKCAESYPQEFVNALKNVALSGLSLSPTIKQGYLVPFKGKVTFMPSYMGLHDLLTNNGHVKKIEAHLVFEGDMFEIEYGNGEKLIHKPNPWSSKTKETLLGGYWFSVLADGTYKFDNMTKEQIDSIMQRSPSVKDGKTSPWQTDYLEMARKTILRQGFKHLPKGSISEDKLKVLEAAFDYDLKEEKEYIKNANNPKKGFDDGEEVTDYELVEE